MEFLGGRLLYAMRVISHGSFNLCPSPVCNPENGAAGSCSIPLTAQKPVAFYPCHKVPPEAVAAGERIMAAAGIDVGAVEYLEAESGERVFYDINANSNLRPSVAAGFGLDPFEQVAKWLIGHIEAVAAGATN
jgi:hypothetical protein